MPDDDLADFMTARAVALVKGSSSTRTACAQTSIGPEELYFSGPSCSLVKTGLPRQKAYEMVRRLGARGDQRGCAAEISGLEAGQISPSVARGQIRICVGSTPRRSCAARSRASPASRAVHPRSRAHRSSRGAWAWTWAWACRQIRPLPHVRAPPISACAGAGADRPPIRLCLRLCASGDPPSPGWPARTPPQTGAADPPRPRHVPPARRFRDHRRCSSRAAGDRPSRRRTAVGAREFCGHALPARMKKNQAATGADPDAVDQGREGRSRHLGVEAPSCSMNWIKIGHRSMMPALAEALRGGRYIPARSRA